MAEGLGGAALGEGRKQQLLVYQPESKNPTTTLYCSPDFTE